MDWLKLEIYIPESHFPALQKALQSADAGHIGNYDSCLSYSRVKGTWRPLQGARPYIGEEGTVSEAEELKVEVNVRIDKLDSTLRAIRNVHPYKEPVINVIPLYAFGAR
ncbi:cytochrome c biogenesis protein [Selenomonas sp. AB3002]|uniref:cytochrome c biogenesis protein n=1 Tax=Selenomonas sp. AB3002 TaxID=1392502 RepID=UPI00049786CC